MLFVMFRLQINSASSSLVGELATSMGFICIISHVWVLYDTELMWRFHIPCRGMKTTSEPSHRIVP